MLSWKIFGLGLFERWLCTIYDRIVYFVPWCLVQFMIVLSILRDRSWLQHRVKAQETCTTIARLYKVPPFDLFNRNKSKGCKYTTNRRYLSAFF